MASWFVACVGTQPFWLRPQLRIAGRRSWQQVLNTAMLGDLRHWLFWTGDINGDGRTEVQLFVPVSDVWAAVPYFGGQLFPVLTAITPGIFGTP